MTVIIAGGGIAGQTLALSCHQAGIAAQVFEASEAIAPLGVGINLQPHAVRELFDLGLAETLDEIGVRTSAVAYFAKTGRSVWQEPRGQGAGYNWPQYSIHRGHLQMMLADRVRERLGTPALETGMRLVDFDQDGDGVVARFADSSGNVHDVHGDMLIGCDGIHSRVRSTFFPDEGPPLWGGAILWRGTTWAEPFLDGATMAMAGHEWQKFVTYPISQPDPRTGRALINFIAELKFDPSRPWRREDYNRRADLDDFLPAFAGWRFDWLDVPALIESAEAIFEYPMVDRDPLPWWTRGRVTLAGDAAHAMYPIGSNGASQAIVDSRVLVASLMRSESAEAALVAYEEARRETVNRIVLANRGNGPDQILQIVEERCGGQFDHIDDVLGESERATIAADYKKLAGFDIDALNAAPPTIAV